MKFKLSGFFIKALGSETLDERYTEAMRLAGTFLSLEYLSSADEFTSLPRVAGQETLFFPFLFFVWSSQKVGCLGSMTINELVELHSPLELALPFAFITEKQSDGQT